ncbi:MAG: deoxyribodipyrimidine photo-lyase, partial [Nocardioidaceae bacterium]
MVTKIALLTRDLRVHDNPVLRAAARADRTLPVFVLDEGLLAGSFNRPNRAVFLRESLRDLRRSLKTLGGGLALRRGDTAVEVARLVGEVGASEVHVASDVSGHAAARERRLRDLLAEQGCALHVHDAVVTALPPAEVTPAGKDHFAVFTPYFRRWSATPRRASMPPPAGLRLPSVPLGRLPARTDICDGHPSPDLSPGGETEGRRRLRRWLSAGVADYRTGQNDMSVDATSRLSPYLHFG